MHVTPLAPFPDHPPPLVSSEEPACTCDSVCPTHQVSINRLLDPSGADFMLSDDDDGSSVLTYVTDEGSRPSSPFPPDPIRFSSTLPFPPLDAEALAAGAAAVHAALMEEEAYALEQQARAKARAAASAVEPTTAPAIQPSAAPVVEPSVDEGAPANQPSGGPAQAAASFEDPIRETGVVGPKEHTEFDNIPEDLIKLGGPFYIVHKGNDPKVGPHPICGIFMSG